MDIPIIKGETGQSCGVACLRSVFSFYGKDVSEKEVWEHNKLKSNINWIYDLGFAAIKFSFKAKIIDYNYFIFKLGVENAADYLRGNSFMGSAKDAAESALEFLEAGGKIEVRVFTLDDIKTYLDKGIPVILRVKPKIYLENTNPNGLHYIVAESYSGNKFKIVDPMGIKREIAAEILLYSAYSSFAQLLIIEK